MCSLVVFFVTFFLNNVQFENKVQIEEMRSKCNECHSYTNCQLGIANELSRANTRGAHTLHSNQNAKIGLTIRIHTCDGSDRVDPL